MSRKEVPRAGLVKAALSPTPVHNIADFFALVLPYWLVGLAPIAGYCLAHGSFPAGRTFPPFAFRLSFYGAWRDVSPEDARSSPAYGPAGFMASMLVGLLLNVVLRTGEFVFALPALNGHAPPWGTALFHVMAADVVAMTFFYMVCFVMALRGVPHFPRMLLFVWVLDIFAQLAIANHLAGMAELPPSVAQPMHDLLRGNIYKVLISALVWLPYLILSERVNLTYRLRMRRK